MNLQPWKQSQVFRYFSKLTMNVTFGKPELSGASALAKAGALQIHDVNLAIGLELSNSTLFQY